MRVGTRFGLSLIRLLPEQSCDPLLVLLHRLTVCDSVREQPPHYNTMLSVGLIGLPPKTTSWLARISPGPNPREPTGHRSDNRTAMPTGFQPQHHLSPTSMPCLKAPLLTISRAFQTFRHLHLKSLVNVVPVD